MNRTGNRVCFPPSLGVKPNRFAINAVVPVIAANATAKTCDSEETDPIKSSGEGMAYAVLGANRDSPKNRPSRC